jgi:hypothetical protein
VKVPSFVARTTYINEAECNCHPAGVTRDFAGCASVPPGELCTCRENVHGRKCDTCIATTWDLRADHDDGCVGRAITDAYRA